MPNETYNANYFFRDYVTEDILSYCVGEVYIYHYKETIIGVRDNAKKVGFFLDVATLPKQNNLYAPTIEQITEQHVKDCIEEIDHTGEDTQRVPISELVPHALRLMMAELAGYMDKVMLNEA